MSQKGGHPGGTGVSASIPGAGASHSGLRFKPVTIGDLIRDGKLLEVLCEHCRPERHLYLNPEILRLPKRMPVPEVARHLVCSKCGARNSETYNPIWARPDARVGSESANKKRLTSVRPIPASGDQRDPSVAHL